MGREVMGQYGKIIISKEVISKLAGIATTECFGVVGMVSSNIFADGIAEILGRESLSKGVDVLLKEDLVTVKVNVVVSYGLSIAVIAKNIIDNVKYIIEKYVGVIVNHVEVNIQGVRVLD
ncbi:MAG: Asp23/Gls24 family envelope stress response protein [Bacillota bacterium]